MCACVCYSLWVLWVVGLVVITRCEAAGDLKSVLNCICTLYTVISFWYQISIKSPNLILILCDMVLIIVLSSFKYYIHIHKCEICSSESFVLNHYILCYYGYLHRLIRYMQWWGVFTFSQHFCFSYNGIVDILHSQTQISTPKNYQNNTKKLR